MFFISADLTRAAVYQFNEMRVIDAGDAGERATQRVDAAVRTHFLKWIAAYFVVL